MYGVQLYGHPYSVNINGRIKNRENLLAGIGIFLFWLLFFGLVDSGTVDKSEMVSVKSKLMESPLWVETSEYEELQLTLEGYKKTFTVGGFILESMCYEAFMENAVEGMDISVFIKKNVSEELNEEFKINNTLSVYQIELEDQEYISIDLYNTLRKADHQILNYGLVLSIICLIYAFISKPKVNIWILIVLSFVLSYYLLFQMEKDAYIEYNPCIKVLTQK